MGQSELGLHLYSRLALCKVGVFGPGDLPPKHCFVLFLSAVRATHNTKCFDLPLGVEFGNSLFSYASYITFLLEILKILLARCRKQTVIHKRKHIEASNGALISPKVSMHSSTPSLANRQTVDTYVHQYAGSFHNSPDVFCFHQK